MKNLPPPSRHDAEPPIIYVPSTQQQVERRSSFFRTCLLLAVGASVACAVIAVAIFVLREQIFPPPNPEAITSNSAASDAALTAQAETNQQLATLQAESLQGKATIQALQTAAAQGNSAPAQTAEPSQANVVPTTAVESKCRWAVQAYNATDPNDLNQTFVNGVPVLKQPDSNGMLQDTAWLNISNRIVEGKENVVRFAVFSGDEGASWGFRIRRGEEIVVDERGASPAGETGGVFDTAYRLTDDCQVQPLQPTGDQWVIEGEYDNWAGMDIFVDGAEIRTFGNKEPSGTFSYDISKWVRDGQKVQISINGRDYAPMNGGTSFTFRIQKNGQVIFSKDLHEQSESFEPFILYILPDGRLSLNGS